MVANLARRRRMMPRCAAGDGERLERVQPPGERRGVAAGGPAGADEPQRSSSGPWV